MRGPQGRGHCSVPMTTPTCGGRRLLGSECLLGGAPARPSGHFYQVPRDPETLEGASQPPSRPWLFPLQPPLLEFSKRKSQRGHFIHPWAPRKAHLEQHWDCPKHQAAIPSHAGLAGGVAGMPLGLHTLWHRQPGTAEAPTTGGRDDPSERFCVDGRPAPTLTPGLSWVLMRGRCGLCHPLGSLCSSCEAQVPEGGAEPTGTAAADTAWGLESAEERGFSSACTVRLSACVVRGRAKCLASGCSPGGCNAIHFVCCTHVQGMKGGGDDITC